MSQYKHDRFFKFFIAVVYRLKGSTLKNIQVHNDEDLEIDLMFVGDLSNESWNAQDLGLFDQLMKANPTIIIEHYSGYLKNVDVDDCITRKHLYWKPQRKELIKSAKVTQNLSDSQRLPPAEMAKIENSHPFTWILTVNCGQSILQDCCAKTDDRFGTGVYLLPKQFRMGIVVISQIPVTPDTLWLRMLGNGDSTRQAFAQMSQLGPGRGSVSNDIMALCVKYCAYLKDIDVSIITPEEDEFMRTMEEIDAWYEAQMSQARLEGERLGEARGEARGEAKIVIRQLNRRFGNISPPLLVQIQQLDGSQLEELGDTLLDFSAIADLEAWLARH
jgi:hypothetical protein